MGVLISGLPPGPGFCFLDRGPEGLNPGGASWQSRIAVYRTKRVTDPEKQAEAPAPNLKVAEKGAAIKRNLDKVLDEIDNVLEANAEEFVKSYVQRGGE